MPTPFPGLQNSTGNQLQQNYGADALDPTYNTGLNSNSLFNNQWSTAQTSPTGGLFGGQGWDPNLTALFQQDPKSAIANLFVNSGQSLDSPFFQIYQQLAPGMKWMDALTNNGTLSDMQSYFTNMMNNFTTPGARMTGIGGVGNMASHFLNSVYGNGQGLSALTQNMSPNDLLNNLGDIINSSFYASGINPDLAAAYNHQLQLASAALSGVPNIFENMPTGQSPAQAALDWLKQHAGNAGGFLNALGF
jgi:hypothetical protein